MPGAQCTRSLVRAGGSEVCAPVFTAEAPETSGIPHAVVYDLLRALPGDRAFLPPSSVTTCAHHGPVGLHTLVPRT